MRSTAHLSRARAQLAMLSHSPKRKRKPHVLLLVLEWESGWVLMRLLERFASQGKDLPLQLVLQDYRNCN
jgi:hypothetical protein